MSKVFDELKARGLIAQTTNEEKIRELLNEGKVTFYTGFDPTADSLHVGHMLQLIVMAHLQRAGHTPIALIGGATALIGDPTGRDDMRSMLTEEQVNNNAQCFVTQMKNLVDFSEKKGLMVNNGDWLKKLGYIELLRDYGVHFSVNRMLTAECFKCRMEKGLSFLEFNYMIMQSYDFLHLNREYNCILECGGDDQWSNILGGVDLIRRIEGKDAYGITFSLLTTSEGKKMGKTQGGAIWINPNRTSPFEFYQYWRNTADTDVIKCLKMLTFIPLEEIAKYEHLEGNELNPIKELLAYEVTKIVHGEEEANNARNAAKALFGQGNDNSNMPATKLEDSDFVNGNISIVELLVKAELAPSKKEARRLVEQGGIEIADRKINDPAEQMNKEDFKNDIIIKKGKKTFHKIKI
jgi:tyrosyl-tRNA synthetase